VETSKAADFQIGKRVKAYRDRNNWSQAELANQLVQKNFRVYGSTVAKIEAGERPVKAAELAAMADVFGISTDTLLGRDRRADANADRAEAALVVADTATRASAAAAEHAEKIGRRALELGAATNKLPHHEALIDGCVEGHRQLVAACDVLAEVGRVARGIVHNELKAAGLE
jgi:transcriptional regulator with XRE-family HTH domain